MPIYSSCRWKGLEIEWDSPVCRPLTPRVTALTSADDTLNSAEADDTVDNRTYLLRASMSSANLKQTVVNGIPCFQSHREQTPSRRKKYFVFCVLLVVAITALSTTTFGPKLASSPIWRDTNYYIGRYLNFTTPTQPYHAEGKEYNSTNSSWKQEAQTLPGTVQKPRDSSTAPSTTTGNVALPSISSKFPSHSSSVATEKSSSVNYTANASRTVPQVITPLTTTSVARVLDSTSTTTATNPTVANTTTTTATTTTTTTATTTTVATTTATTVATTPATTVANPTTSTTTTSTNTSTLSQGAHAQNTTHLDDRKLLCHTFTGRLGNELFQYASVWGLALTMNRIPVFFGGGLEDVLNKSFKHLTRQAEFQQRCAKSKASGESSCCTYSEYLTKLEPAFDYSVGTYLQSWKYWQGNEERVKRQLQFSDAIKATAGRFVNDLRQQHKDSVLISVHVRQGDFTSQHNMELGYRTATPDYIRRALYFFRKRYPKSVFVVTSDGVEWCKKNFPTGFTIHYLESNTPAVDLLVLSSMDHIVTSFGSYSWWAGYLNNGTTLYIRDFIVPDTFIGNQFKPDGEDYIYPGWIPM